jgi:hypothetical protein
MKKILTASMIFMVFTTVCSVTHVFWYKAKTNNYQIVQSNPGPSIPANSIVHQGMIASGYSASMGSKKGPTFGIGGGRNGDDARCGFLWSKDLNEASGIAVSAKIRGEYDDGWAKSALCMGGPIHLRYGVINYARSIQMWKGADKVPNNASWIDFLNPLYPKTGFDAGNPELAAEDSILLQAPEGRSADKPVPSKLDGKFFELDITKQVNYILSNPGQFALVFLADTGRGSTGKIYVYSAEDHAEREDPTYSDNPWTNDFNTVHLLVESGNLSIENQPVPHSLILNNMSLGQNIPNPFQSRITIPYNTGNNQEGSLIIYNANGRKVFSLKLRGRGALKWNAENLANGIYFCCLKVKDKRVYIRMILAR